MSIQTAHSLTKSNVSSPSYHQQQQQLQPQPSQKQKGKLLYSSVSTNSLHPYAHGVEACMDLESTSPQDHPLNQIYLLDFGLSEFYVDRHTHMHVQNRLRPPCGTPRYMSIRTHQFRRKFFFFFLIIILHIYIIS